jgi:hypothetical protein
LRFLKEVNVKTLALWVLTLCSFVSEKHAAFVFTVEMCRFKNRLGLYTGYKAMALKEKG